MKSFGILLTLTALATSVFPRWALADGTASTTTPVVVPQEGDKGHLLRDLAGLPDNVKNLILVFDQTRGTYLRQQSLLLAALRHASTPDQQEQLRQQLQANRQQFLTDLKSFLQEQRSVLQELKGKIGHAEFGRLIEAAHSVSAEAGHRHRGQ